MLACAYTDMWRRRYAKDGPAEGGAVDVLCSGLFLMPSHQAGSSFKAF